MKKILTNVLAALSVLAMASGTTLAATPSEEEVKADITTFQDFFKQRFKDVALEDYADGVNALPQYADRRANWEMALDFPNYEEYVDQGREEWAVPFANGKTFDSCFEGSPPANTYPYVDGEGKLHSVEGDIQACLKANGEEKIKGGGQKMARLTIVYKERANGEKMAIDYSSEEMREIYARGREFYWTKRGQLGLSCADCHVRSAGSKIRGDVLSAGLGHGIGFPAYRTKWGLTEKPLGTIHRRYAGCNKQTRAAKFKALGDQYMALEVYESIMNTGIPLKVPSQRQ